MLLASLFVAAYVASTVVVGASLVVSLVRMITKDPR